MSVTVVDGNEARVMAKIRCIVGMRAVARRFSADMEVIMGAHVHV